MAQAMTHNDRNTAAEHRQRAEEYEAQIDALEDLRHEVMEADSIGDTRLSELFHEARTNRPDVWNSATAFIVVEDGEAVVDHVSKLREGSWSPETRDRFDALISVGVRPFMDTAEFRDWVDYQVQEAIQGASQNAHHARETAEHIERHGMRP